MKVNSAAPLAAISQFFRLEKKRKISLKNYWGILWKFCVFVQPIPFLGFSGSSMISFVINSSFSYVILKMLKDLFSLLILNDHGANIECRTDLPSLFSIMRFLIPGVSNEGISGLFTGIGKGLVGTVTKPAVGMLDLATGAASAVRDSSRTSAKLKEIPRRIRPPRLVIGPGGILPRYSERQGRGQELLFQMSQHIYQVTRNCTLLRHWIFFQTSPTFTNHKTDVSNISLLFFSWLFFS